ncbi:hypothetical protein NE237_000811 [Protea cynaroides]|uniref:Uncharacterized protein n=1 Tax=Protea cynaroides TaxID=273540 RepID=A0A9Q0QXV0_9MAGN|nr:hypothetical protein NE237_000811 [Protea cynaroides]
MNTTHKEIADRKPKLAEQNQEVTSKKLQIRNRKSSDLPESVIESRKTNSRTTRNCKLGKRNYTSTRSCRSERMQIQEHLKKCSRNGKIETQTNLLTRETTTLISAKEHEPERNPLRPEIWQESRRSGWMADT